MRSLLRPLASLLLVLLVTAGLVDHSPTPAPDTYRPDPRVDVLHYSFNLELSDDTDEIAGEATVRLRLLTGDVESVRLNLVGTSENTGMTVRMVSVDGSPLAYQHRNDLLDITLPARTAETEVLSITIAYRGVPADGLIISKNKYGDRTFFGDNWPNRARYWLPTVDHPADKATCGFSVTAPTHYQVIGSGSLQEETDLGNGYRRTHWKTSVPMATKVMVIGAARFAVDHVGDVRGIPVESWVYPQDRAAGFYDYALAIGILQYFSDTIGPYPYKKLANVQSKTRYGGMENAGNIFYSENSVRGDRGNEGLLAHEIAHQWFGDSVTEADWHHVWLSEGFATYFTQLYMEHTYGRERLIRAMQSTRGSVLQYADNHPESPVVDTTITNLNRLLSTNSYAKGGWVLHMLRGQFGDDVFWSSIRSYYERNRDGNAWTADFRESMEHAAGQNLDWFFDQWIFRPGYPIVEGDWSHDSESGKVTMTFRQVQKWEPFKLNLDVGIYLDGEPRPHVVQVDLSGRTHTFVIETASTPSRIVLDPDTRLLMEGRSFKHNQ